MRPRGFLMIVVLLLSVLLLTMGLGFLSSRVSQYRSTTHALLATRVRALARAGLEDARSKLNQDIEFPPPGANQQHHFTYSEDFSDASGNFIGSYQVEVDSSYASAPFSVLLITSTGFLGRRQAPTAVHSLRATLDIDPDSSRFYQVIRWEDLGVP